MSFVDDEKREGSKLTERKPTASCTSTLVIEAKVHAMSFQSCGRSSFIVSDTTVAEFREDVTIVDCFVVGNVTDTVS